MCGEQRSLRGLDGHLAAEEQGTTDTTYSQEALEETNLLAEAILLPQQAAG